MAKCKIVECIIFIEFKYISYLNEIYDSCYMDELNIRLPLQCIPRMNNDDINYIGKKIRIYWSHYGILFGGEWYQTTIQSIDTLNKILILFYKDRYMEELRYNVKTTLFYFPITDLNQLTNNSNWIYLRPNCKFCGCFMKEKTVTKCKYRDNVCWKCDNLFLQKDSIWICPFEKKVNIIKKILFMFKMLLFQ